jgi:hypothetical protein
MAYLTAKAARVAAEATQCIDGEYMRADTDRIIGEIHKLAMKGEFMMVASFALHKVIVKRLEHIGYTVEITSDQRDGDWTTITW